MTAWEGGGGKTNMNPRTHTETKLLFTQINHKSLLTKINSLPHSSPAQGPLFTLYDWEKAFFFRFPIVKQLLQHVFLSISVLLKHS